MPERQSRTPGTRRLGIIRALGLVVAGIALALLLIEGGLRAMPQYLQRGTRLQLGVFRAQLAFSSTFEADAYLEHKLKPHLDVLIEGYPDYRYHVKTYLNFRHAGFRGNVVRRPLVGIALGDSFTFGMGVEAEEAWPEQLSQLAGRNFANLGVADYGPPQYTRVLGRYGLALRPKLVLYAIYENDLRDAILFAQWQKEGGGPYDALRKKGLFAKWLSLARYSRLYQLLLAQVFLPARRDPDFWRAAADQGRQLVEESDLPVEASKIAWGLVQEAILSAQRLTQEKGATLVVLLIPSKGQTFQLGTRWGDELDRAVLRLCEAARLRCLDLRPRFQERALAGEQLYFRIDGHWNAAGHRLAARTIYDYLLSQRLLEGSTR
ncbi:MAG: hypothetical protein HY278_04725 [candidate division NC10 bacterium]|nr:hypothetical protein [candidate division NC10 bacterium]